MTIAQDGLLFALPREHSTGRPALSLELCSLPGMTLLIVGDVSRHLTPTEMRDLGVELLRWAVIVEKRS
jgi:hypothetical protein